MGEVRQLTFFEYLFAINIPKYMCVTFTNINLMGMQALLLTREIGLYD